MTETSYLHIPENLVDGKKILRVFDGYAKKPDNFLDLFLSGDTAKHEQKIIELFESNGFEIAKGKFNENNPLEVGISDDSDINKRDRDLEIAKKVGVDMPKIYSPTDVLRTSSSVVAKVPGADRGELKYLLETTDQKVKFVSWALLYQNIKNLPSGKDEQKAVLDRIFKNVSEGILEDENIENQGWLNDWVFEEFINTPGDFNSSIRVVVDGFGNFYYAQVTRSEKAKTSEMIPKVGSLILTKPETYSFNLTKLLENPNSPFYIKPKNFMSNIAQGGKRIILDGNSIKDVDDRKLLFDLGLNFDKPSLPTDLLKYSKEIGKLYRRYYPDVGIDFLIQDNSKKRFLLEVNKGPHISALALGLPENNNPNDCELELMKRMIFSIK